MGLDPRGESCSSGWRSPCGPTSRRPSACASLDVTLIAVVLAMLVQLVPLPAG